MKVPLPKKAIQLSNQDASIALTVMVAFVPWLALARESLSQPLLLFENIESSLIGNRGMVWIIESFSSILLFLMMQVGIRGLVLRIADIGGGTLAPP